jgi:hypothetical protein
MPPRRDCHRISHYRGLRDPPPRLTKSLARNPSARSRNVRGGSTRTQGGPRDSSVVSRVRGYELRTRFFPESRRDRRLRHYPGSPSGGKPGGAGRDILSHKWRLKGNNISFVNYKRRERRPQKSREKVDQPPAPPRFLSPTESR